MDSLIKQSQATRKNGLSVSKSGNAYKTGSCYGNSQTISVSGGNHRHSIDNLRKGAGSEWGRFTFKSNDEEGTDIRYTGYSGDLSMSGTMTPSITDNIGVTDNISVSLGDGDIETRPENYTIKIWKRIS